MNLRTIFALALAIALASPTARSQSAVTASDAPQGTAVLTKLAPPVYPAIARAAHVTGDVGVTVEVKSDGSVDSVVATSGPPLLTNAATYSARQSQFECQGCGEAATPIHLTYTFQLTDTACCTTTQDQTHAPSPPIPGVTRSENHVTIVDYPTCICDAAALTKVRSLKCLYLWRCRLR